MKAAPEVIRLQWQHYSHVAGVLERAFLDYTLMTYCVPEAKRRTLAVKSLYSAALRYSLRYGRVYSTPDLDGAACWLPPDSPFPTFLRMVRCGMLALPFRFGGPGFKRLQAADKVAEHLHHAHAPGPHWYLWVIGVDPARQSMGIAGRLMRPVFEEADRERYRCYLETHKESNVRTYERYGFRVVSQTPVPKHALTVWAMLRSAGAMPVVVS
jgi:ribosomal protein S18 acetylase RimI-like enzyme